MEIDVRELEAELPAILERVAGGDVITITDRGRPKAVLSPPLRPDGALSRGIAGGWIRPATSTVLAAAPRHRGRHRVLDVLDDDRASGCDEAGDA